MTLGVYQLNCNPNALRVLHKDLVNRTVGSKDGEGEFFVVNRNELLRLLVEGKCQASSLYYDKVPDIVEVCSENLHPTSRYRLFRLLRAANRRPLELQDYDRLTRASSSRSRLSRPVQGTDSANRLRSWIQRYLQS
jgi:hypothetical protein